MSDFFDDLTSSDAAPIVELGAPMNVLVVGTPCVNEAEVDARARLAEEILWLELPQVFESDTGELENELEFAALRTRLGRKPTPAEALAYLTEIERPIIAKHAPLIAAARATGSDRVGNDWTTRGAS